MQQIVCWLFTALFFMPAWGEDSSDWSRNEKPYSEMTLWELRQEEARLRKHLIEIGARLSNAAFHESKAYNEWLTFIKDEVNQNERERRKGRHIRRLNRERRIYEESPVRGTYHQYYGELNEYTVDLPLASDNEGGKKNLKVKLRPGVIPLLNKKIDLDKMLIGCSLNLITDS